jgi:hypothetical protein
MLNRTPEKTVPEKTVHEKTVHDKTVHEKTHSLTPKQRKLLEYFRDVFNSGYYGNINIVFRKGEPTSAKEERSVVFEQ